MSAIEIFEDEGLMAVYLEQFPHSKQARFILGETKISDLNFFFFSTVQK